MNISFTSEQILQQLDDCARSFTFPMLERVPADLPRIFQLEEWHHPDLAGDELPSRSRTFQIIAMVLETGDADQYRPVEEPNTHWRFWPDGGTL